MPGRKAPGRNTDPYAVFRPRRGRVVALSCAVLALALFGALAVILPGPQEGFSGWHLADRVMLVAFGLAFAAVLGRFASLSAVPTAEGLVVRNLATTRRLTWAEIVHVQYPDGAPWVSLDLDDTDTVAVMAIQRADGVYALAEAGRLSALVFVNGSAGEH